MSVFSDHPQNPIGFDPTFLTDIEFGSVQSSLDLFEVTRLLIPGAHKLGAFENKCIGKKEGCPKSNADTYHTCDCKAYEEVVLRTTRLVERVKEYGMVAVAFDKMLSDALQKLFKGTGINPYTLLQFHKLLAAVISKVRFSVLWSIIDFKNMICEQIIEFGSESDKIRDFEASPQSVEYQSSPVSTERPYKIFASQSWKPFSHPHANLDSAKWAMDEILREIMPVLDDLESLDLKLDKYIIEARRYNFPAALEHKSGQISHARDYRFESSVSPSECYVILLGVRAYWDNINNQKQMIEDLVNVRANPQDLDYIRFVQNCSALNLVVSGAPECQNLCLVHLTSGVTKAGWSHNSELNTHETRLRDLRLGARTCQQIAVAVDHTEFLRRQAATQKSLTERQYVMANFPEDSPLRVHEGCVWLTFDANLGPKPRCDRCRTHWNARIVTPEGLEPHGYLRDKMDTETGKRADPSQRPAGRCAEAMTHECCIQFFQHKTSRYAGDSGKGKENIGMIHGKGKQKLEERETIDEILESDVAKDVRRLGRVPRLEEQAMQEARLSRNTGQRDLWRQSEHPHPDLPQQQRTGDTTSSIEKQHRPSVSSSGLHSSNLSPPDSTQAREAAKEKAPGPLHKAFNNASMTSLKQGYRTLRGRLSRGHLTERQTPLPDERKLKAEEARKKKSKSEGGGQPEDEPGPSRKPERKSEPGTQRK